MSDTYKEKLTSRYSPHRDQLKREFPLKKEYKSLKRTPPLLSKDPPQTLVNMAKYVKYKGDIFIVANDKFNLYPETAKESGLDSAHVYSRPVLTRSEDDRHPYTEKIFRMRKSTKTCGILAVFSL